MRWLAVVAVVLAATACFLALSSRSEGPGPARIAELERRVADLEQDVRAQRDAIETLEAAGPRDSVAVRSSIGLPLVPNGSVPAIAGKVVAVDTKLNIVVLSVGRTDGVKPGTTFTIHRGKTYVGRVVVDDVQKDHCAGYSKAELQAKTIEVGDGARTP